MIQTLKAPMLIGRSMPTSFGSVLPTSVAGSTSMTPAEITLITLLPCAAAVVPTPDGSSFHCL